MKKNLFYLFALICSMSLFTACSDDDETPDYSKAIEEEITGNYKGTLDIELDEMIIASDLPKNITITKAGNAEINLLLADFNLMGMELGNIELKNCLLNQKDASYSFIGTTTLNIEQYQLTADVNATGTIANGKITVLLDITAKLNGMAQKVKVTYTGTKLTGTESSEAKITAFTFDNELVTEQPVIDNEAGTITFKVSDQATENDLKALKPVVTISEKATVTPASGVAQDFSGTNKVTYTVTAEDGTVATYLVYIAGKNTVLSYDFEEWAVPENAMYKDVIQPTGWATCNDAVALIKNMGSLAGITYDGAYPVRETDDCVSGDKALLAESVDTKGGAIFGQKVPKVTAGTAFLGTFNAFAAMSNPMATTSFGNEYTGKPLEVKGFFKYIAGTEFYNSDGELDNSRKDRCTIAAILYEVTSDTETLDGSNIYTSPNIVAKAMLNSEVQAEYAPFTLKLDYVKEYAADKKYKFAVIFSASEDGANYNAAVGSKLYIDNVMVINE